MTTVMTGLGEHTVKAVVNRIDTPTIHQNICTSMAARKRTPVIVHNCKSTLVVEVNHFRIPHHKKNPANNYIDVDPSSEHEMHNSGFGFDTGSIPRFVS